MSDERTDDEVLEDIVEKVEEEPGFIEFDYREYQHFEQELAAAMVSGDLERDSREFAKITVGRLATGILDDWIDLQEEIEEALDGIKGEYSEVPEEDLQESVKYARNVVERSGVLSEIYDEIILFFTLTYSLIEEFSREVLEEELITEEFQNTKKTETLLKRRFSQEMREKLLLRCGILENGVVSEMGHVRSIRNQLTHDLDQQQFLDPMEDIESEIDRSIAVLNELHQKLADEPFLSRKV